MVCHRKRYFRLFDENCTGCQTKFRNVTSCVIDNVEERDLTYPLFPHIERIVWII